MNATISGEAQDELSSPAPATFRVVRYPECLTEILALRRLAYHVAQKSGPDHAESAEIDETDPRNLKAHTVIAENSGQIIGSIRLTPPLSGSLLHPTCRIKEPVEGLPPRSEFIEASWACVHPEHQGKGLFWHIAAHMVLTAKQLGRSFLVGSTDTALWKNWKRCGYRKLGATYSGALSGNTYWLMMLDLEEVTAGKNIAPVFADVLLPLLARHQATYPPADD